MGCALGAGVDSCQDINLEQRRLHLLSLTKSNVFACFPRTRCDASSHVRRALHWLEEFKAVRLQLWVENLSLAWRKYQSSDVFLLPSAGAFWKLCCQDVQ